MANGPKDMREAAQGLISRINPNQGQSPTQYLRNLQLQGIQKQAEAAEQTTRKLKELEEQEKQIDLTPFALGVDQLTGSNLAQKYQAMRPQNQEEKEMLLSKLQSQQYGGLTDDLIQLQQQDYLSNKLRGQANQGLSPFQEMLDKELAKDAAKWLEEAPSAEANIGRLREVQQELQQNPDLYPPTVMPKGVRAFTNPKSVDAQENVEFVAQQSLKKILGGQFSEREGKQLIERTYNPKLPASVRAERLGTLIDQLDNAMQRKNQAIEWASRYGSLRDFPYSESSTLSGFEKELKKEIKAIGQEDGGQGAGTQQGMPDFDNMSDEELVDYIRGQ